MTFGKERNGLHGSPYLYIWKTQKQKRNIKLIAFDLDGTTLHGFAELSERNRRAMEKANDADILVVPATGRVRNFIPPCLTELPFIRYAITSNGGAVWDILENKVLCTDLIPTETALEVQKIFDDYELYVEYYVHGRGVTKRGNPDKARTVFGFPGRKILLPHKRLYVHGQPLRVFKRNARRAGKDQYDVHSGKRPPGNFGPPAKVRRHRAYILERR